MKFVGVILIVMGILAALGAVQRGSGVESYAISLIFVLLGVGAIAQRKTKRKEG